MSYLRKIEYKIVPEKSYAVIHNCGGCGHKERFVNTKRFRVNANGNKLDVWLIYQCEKCKHTLNLPIYERRDKAKMSPEEYLLFMQNDEDLAEEYGRDYGFLSRNRMEADWQSMDYYILDMDGNARELETIEFQTGDRIDVHNPHAVKLRPEKMVGMVLDISRSAVKKLLDEQKIIIEQKSGDLEIVIC